MARVSVLFVFFFSSRRRHTRLVSDWSSDVCSSDLHPLRHFESQGFTAALVAACRLAVARGVSSRPRFLETVDVLEKLVCGFIGYPLVDFTRAAVAVGLAQGSYQDGSVSC